MKNFIQYVSEETSKNLEYGPAGSVQQHIMQKDITLFDINDINKIASEIPPPPSNDNQETLHELKTLETITKQRSSGEAESAIKYDDKFTDDYFSLFADKNIQVSMKEIKYLSSQVGIVVMRLKYRYQRPRPKQLGKILNIDIKNISTISGNSPAYPSGHSTQSKFLSLYYSEKYPELEIELTQLAENVGMSRIHAGLHYPSDHKTGKLLAKKLIGMVKQ